MATANQIRDDHNYVLEDSSVSGNLFDNDGRTNGTTGPYEEFTVQPGTLNNPFGENNGEGLYGTLVVNDDGTYTYTVNPELNNLSEGEDVLEDGFTVRQDYTDNNGDPQHKIVWISFTIHGKNDAAVVNDVNVSVFEGGDAGLVPSQGGTVDIYNGQFTLADIDPATDGVQTDFDTNDVHRFEVDNGTITITSNDLTEEQIAVIKDSVTVSLANPNAVEGDADWGVYTVEGDFDALSEGNQAIITFQYRPVDVSPVFDGFDNVATPGEYKTATITVVGQNDSVSIVDDAIGTYNQLIDGDIYKSILANDGHYENGVKADDIDVNDTLTIASTGFHDLQFYQEGGSISVDNAAKVLQYTPGSGGAIAKDHFSFYYQATDGHTDPIGSAVAEFAMENKNGDAIDWYQFGDSGNDTINGIAGATNVLSGMAGDDYIEGKEKGDILYGGAGDDMMQGGWGDDIYKGGTGNDGIVDTKGNDTYVFSKGDGRDTIDDMNLEIYTDAMGHETINWDYWRNEDVVEFDNTVDYKDIAIFQEEGQYGSLLIKYSDNDNDKVSVGWQQEEHYGIETMTAVDENGNTVSIKNDWWANNDANALNSLDEIIDYIATYDLDGDATNGIQTAQNVQDVQNNEHLMTVINAAWA